jgi:hypothetical protein
MAPSVECLEHDERSREHIATPEEQDENDERKNGRIDEWLGGWIDEWIGSIDKNHYVNTPDGRLQRDRVARAIDSRSAHAMDHKDHHGPFCMFA